jgi:SET domain-containing protein
MYRPLPPYLTIKESQIEGLGLFATEDIPQGTDMGVTHIWSGRHKPDNYIRLPLGGFFNHSTTPNAKIVQENDLVMGRHLRLVAIRDIVRGEEVTAQYTLYDPTIVKEG